MEIVASDAAAELAPSVAQETLREMAAVVRTLFGVALHGAALEAPPAPAPAPAPVAPRPPVTPLVPRPATDTPATLPVPGLPVPGLPVPAPAAALAVPGLPDASGVPQTIALDRQQPLDRHSLSLLQEIAFLDD
jgi:hypothetical protein